MKRFRGGSWGRVHIVALVVVVASVVVVATTLAEWALPEDKPEGTDPSLTSVEGSELASSGGQVVFDTVEKLPIDPKVHIAIGLIALVYFAWCWSRRNKILRHKLGFTQQSKDPQLADTDQDVVQELRMRALVSRIRADMLLAGVAASLFGGVYSIVYVSPHVLDKDRQVVKEIVVRERFRSQIDALEKGRYWLQIATRSGPFGVPSLEVGPSRELILAVQEEDDATTLVSRDEGFTWRKADVKRTAKRTSELMMLSARGQLDPTLRAIAPLADGVHITVAEYHASGHGLIGTSDGMVHTTVDGGENWVMLTKDLGLNTGESLVRALVRETGPRLVASDKGSVRVFGADEWKSAGLDLQSRITAFEFHADGRHGLIGTADGAAYATGDGGENWEQWTRQDLGLSASEWVAEAVVGETGLQLVVGDERSVRVLSADGWKSADLNQEHRIEAFEFHAGGRYGLIGMKDGAAYVTDDGGASWARWTRRDLGLNASEWVAEAVVGESGPRLVVGDETTVSVFGADAWRSADLNLQSRITAFEFHADGRHGLIGTADGAAYATGDGGENWEQWTRRDLELYPSEWLAEAVVGEAGPRLVVGHEGSVVVRDDGGWMRTVMPGRGALISKDEGDTLLVSVLANVIRGERGSEMGHTDTKVWFRKDGRWELLQTRFGSESVAATALGEDGRPIVVGNEGSVYTVDGGMWRSNSEFPSAGEETGKVAVAALGDTLTIAAIDDDGVAIYHNRKHSGRNIRRLVASLPEESALREQVLDALRDEGVHYLTGSDDSSNSNPQINLKDFGIDEAFWMRLATMAATIYFVQLLVRLYQYSLRLAALFDSRADAILLSVSFSNTVRKPSFDELIAATTPDGVDFKPPKFPYSWTPGSKRP